ncbi:MAG: ribonuclease HI [Candidatus Collierbacteria bacterium GW2011_GWF2_44_15]|uniref:Ribonuclease HI n=3 Tax=Candidatus Collieribacteriota TaxID=1752725 RepID=A0A0G1HHZ6_9BACT|nr:MAG: ribonuclease HI [Candidatus Collierbacteria bacterium GW2011_GWF2_44_15]KKU28230.1 MAG: ribonuclease HI [Candidatus Collierbacteria bacterium GW2011_GWE1_46_18]
MTKKHPFIEIHTDGGSRGNPGPAGIGVFATTDDKVLFTLSETIGETTNNVAEYTAVIRALENLKEKKIVSEKLRFVLDSELIVRQITGIYKVKQPHLLELRLEIVSLINWLRENNIIDKLSFMTVPREKNQDADRLVNEALDSR